jgi:hypothetical protein
MKHHHNWKSCISIIKTILTVFITVLFSLGNTFFLITHVLFCFDIDEKENRSLIPYQSNQPYRLNIQLFIDFQ